MSEIREEVVEIIPNPSLEKSLGSPSSVEPVQPSTPSTFDSRRFRSTISTIESDISRNSQSYATEKVKGRSRSICRRLCCFSEGDILRVCCQCVMICPMVLCVGSVVLLVSFIISFFTGRVVVREKGAVSVKFFKDFLDQHIEHAKLASHSLAEIDLMRDYLCSPKNESLERELVNQYLLRYVKYNPLHLHHLRLIAANGTEVSRIDLEHDNSASISKVLFDVSDLVYHKNFLDGKDKIPFVGPWHTHGSLPLVPEKYKYEYIGKDQTGDHHLDHLEYLPLPQVIRIHTAVRCNDSFSGGYVILNLRMVLVLKQMDATNELYTVVIINKDKDYIFYNSDRTKEFQSVLKKEQTLDSDWGLGSDSIYDNLYNLGVYVFTIGLNEFMCSKLLYSEGLYFICIVRPSLYSLLESSVPLVLGITINIVFLMTLLCCYYNYIIRRQIKKYEGLIGNIYPKHLPRPMIRGSDKIARYQSNLCIIFADLCKFLEFNENFHSDPYVIVTVLGSMVDVIDVLAEQYKIYKIKTIGNCYFGVSGLSFKRNKVKRKGKRLLKELAKDRERVKDVIKFCSLFLRFFGTRKISIKGRDVEPLSLPQFRVGVSFGGAACGILNKNTPYFDLWGRSVYLASRMESSSEPGRIHVSKRIYEILRGDKERKFFDFQKRKETFIRGYGFVNTYFVRVRNPKNCDKILEKFYKSSSKFRKYEKVYEMKTEEEIKELEQSEKTEMLQEIVLQLETENRNYKDSEILETNQRKADHFGEQFKERRKHLIEVRERSNSENKNKDRVIIPGSFSSSDDGRDRIRRRGKLDEDWDDGNDSSFSVGDDGVEMKSLDEDDFEEEEIEKKRKKKKIYELPNAGDSEIVQKPKSDMSNEDSVPAPSSVIIENGVVTDVKIEYRFGRPIAPISRSETSSPVIIRPSTESIDEIVE